MSYFWETYSSPPSNLRSGFTPIFIHLAPSPPLPIIYHNTFLICIVVGIGKVVGRGGIEYFFYDYRLLYELRPESVVALL